NHYQMKQKADAILNSKLDAVGLDDIQKLIEAVPADSKALSLRYARQILENRDQKAQLLRLLSGFEIEADQEMALSKTLTKMGPILGLMGTLIPMGPALVGLATGDIASMAHNMQVAFATTVVGLLIGAIGFVTLQAKQRWYLQDYTNLEYIARMVNSEVRQMQPGL
ncbi:MAG TPA: hypothetical protein DCM62_01785, partial [Bacteroidales bacterium]|nr:hypothetical protein [Bacteroidales bacterium]